MVRTIIILLSLIKLVLLIGCNTRDYMISNPGSSAKFIHKNPAMCGQAYMKSRGNYACEILFYAALDDLRN